MKSVAASKCNEIELQARPFLDLIDKLREINIEQDIPIPQIAVMGDQSSGKSSVLESLSGIGFPRGAGLVTKCATQIIMKKTPAGTPWKGNVKLIWDNNAEKAQPPGTGSVESEHKIAARIEQLTEFLTKDTTFS